MSSTVSIGNSLATDFAFAADIVAVVAHQRRHVEIGRDPSLALRDQILEPAIRIVGGAEARDLAHRPGLRAVHRRVRAARVRKLSWETEIGDVVEVLDMRRRVNAFDRRTADRPKLRTTFRAAFHER